MYTVIVRQDPDSIAPISRSFDTMREVRKYLKNWPIYLLYKDSDRAPYGGALIEERNWQV